MAKTTKPAPKKPAPPSGAAYWAAHPQQAAQAMAFIQQHSTDQGLAAQVASHKQQYNALVPQKQQKAKGFQRLSDANKVIQAGIQHLTAKGLDPAEAHKQMYLELIDQQYGTQKNIDISKKLIDPLEQYAKDTGDPTAKTIVKLGGTIKDPFQLLGKNTKPENARNALFTAAFARSDLGRQALNAQLINQNPAMAVQASRLQLSNQIMQEYNQVAADGGLADQYDAYLQDKEARIGATTKQKRAMGPALRDPLNTFGYTAKSFKIPAGEPVTGATIKAAMAALTDKEAQSLNGFPQSGTKVDTFIKKLEASGPPGKALAKAMSSGALYGVDAITAYGELASASPANLQQQGLGVLDPQLIKAINAANKVKGSLSVKKGQQIIPGVGAGGAGGSLSTGPQA